MNWIDLLLVAIILVSVWSGWQRGFIVGVLSLFTLLGSLLIGFLVYPYVAGWLGNVAPSLGVWIQPVAFIGTIIFARIVLSFLVNKLLRNTPEDAHQNSANRFLGMLPGFANGYINALLIAALLMALPLFENLSAVTRESRIANQMAGHVEWLDSKLSPVFEEAINRSVNQLTVDPESDKSVDLKFTVKDPKVRQDLEARMLELVNEERLKEGLPPLKADPEIAEVARAHSRDMFARGYFSHVTPEGKTPSDRIRDGGVRFITAGENLALGQTLTICHNGLMNSPGHRANILHKAYGRVGIGILDGGVYGLMITQNFRN